MTMLLSNGGGSAILAVGGLTLPIRRVARRVIQLPRRQPVVGAAGRRQPLQDAGHPPRSDSHFALRAKGVSHAAV